MLKHSLTPLLFEAIGKGSSVVNFINSVLGFFNLSIDSEAFNWVCDLGSFLIIDVLVDGTVSFAMDFTEA